MVKKSKKYLGILGLGSASTCFYIEQLNNKYKLIHGDYSTCPFTLVNTNFNEINPFLPSDFEMLKKNLLPYLVELQNCKTTTLLIPNITLHETIDRLSLYFNGDDSIVHPLKNTVDLLLKNNQKDVVLIGSLYSMNAPYITKYLSENNINVAIPTEKEMKFIDNLRQKIYKNVAVKLEIKKYRDLVNYYSKKKAVVIGCTELSMLYNENNAKVYDMALIQIDKAIALLN